MDRGRRLSPAARAFVVTLSSLGLGSGISLTVALALQHGFHGGPGALATGELSAGLTAFVGLVARRLSE